MRIMDIDYRQLRDDCFAIMKVQKIPEDTTVDRYMWNVFHEVWFQREEPDSHPSFIADPARRILPFIKHGYWQSIYVYLNDGRITTALKKIYEEFTQ
jgi:hypothetical protein